MAESPSSSGGIPWNTILGIIATLGAVAHFVPPLTTSRPAVPQGQNSMVSGLQNVDARLWQDPLQAVDDDISHSAKSKVTEPSPSREFGSLLRQIDDQKIAPKVLAVMLSGLPYAEATESRLRTRLAVVSGLGRSRYVPDDGEHLGYSVVNWPRCSIPDEPTTLSTDPACEKSRGTLEIPFEWWHQQGWRDDAAGSLPTSQKLLVLWLREDSFEDSPLRRLASVFEPLRVKWTKKKWTEKPEFTVIGPTQSATLREMLVEADSGIPCAFTKTLETLSVVSPAATATDETLRLALSNDMRQLRNQFPSGDRWNTSAILQKYGHLKSFHKTIAADDVVCDSLLRELSLRKIFLRPMDKEPSHVAIISEWDTLYGRALPITFAARSLGDENTATSLAEKSRPWPDWVHRFSYLRGIDGKLPGDQTSGGSGEQARPPKTSESPELSAKLMSPRRAEQTEGRDQTDGLRRLSDELFQLNEKIQDKGGIRAVGVLGSDVYDKLLILKALRKGLPGAIFFTTDLDARYSLESELQETKNLLVASPFGLQLSRADLSAQPISKWLTNSFQGLQGDVPPFRDDYQTAMFFSTLYAMNQFYLSDDDLAAAINATRMYEIGRDGPVDLSQRQNHEEIHSPWVDHRERLPGIFQAICVVLACFIPYWFLCNRIGKSPWRPWKWFPRAKELFVTLFVVGVVLIFVVCKGSDRDGEPMILTSGVSIWGTEAIRLLALAFSLGSIAYASVHLKRNMAEVSDEFHLHGGGKTPHDSDRRTLPSLKYQPWRALIDAVKWNRTKVAKIDVATLWAEYRIHGAFDRRLIRVTFYVAGAWMCVLLLSAALMHSNDSHTPARGEIAFAMDSVIIFLTVTAMAAVVFYVGDAARLCKSLAENLIHGETRWPGQPLRRYAKIYDLKDHEIAAFLNVHFLAERSKAIMPMMYYPCVVIFLMIVARSPYFATWQWPMLLIAIFLSVLFATIYDYIMLRKTAEKVRNHSIDKLKAKMASLPAENERRSRLETLLDDIKRIDHGAFIPFSKNPIVGAVLLPFAGLGAWAMIQLFMG